MALFKFDLASLLAGVIAAFIVPFSHANYIPNGGSINFIDNGIITTEYRSDGTVWEWLDITVTNGIGYRSLVADLEDDNQINNSSELYIGNNGAAADISALSVELKSGWSTVAGDELVEMINTFLKPAVHVEEPKTYYTKGFVSIESFTGMINLFGDTAIEGNIDFYGSAAPFLEVGATIGFVSDGVRVLFEEQQYLIELVLNKNKFNPNFEDYSRVSFSDNSFSVPNLHVGTWLNRQVSSVSSPTTSLYYFLVILLLYGNFVLRKNNFVTFIIRRINAYTASLLR